jgi:RNA polymerase sigma-70 factor (ECF subfamily)
VLASDIAAGDEDEREEDFFDRNTGLWRVAPKEWEQPPDAAMERADFRRVLNDCLAKLPETMAQLFVMREADEMDADDVCRTLGISPGNLYVMLHRARLRLRRCLEIHWFGKAGG